jgi:hypothetical protein
MKSSTLFLLFSGLILINCLFACQFACAEEDEYGIEHPKGASARASGDPDYPGAITSIEAMRMGTSEDATSSLALCMMAEYCLKNGYTDKALLLIKHSLERNYDDIDLHKVYAEALEKKWNTQVGKKKDPDIFNACVIEWLIVMRQEVGWEKLTRGGLGIPGIGKLYEDEDQTIPAQQHLLTLTGVLPRVREADDKYLKKVLKPSTAGVKGKILPKGAASDDAVKTGSDDKTESGSSAKEKKTPEEIEEEKNSKKSAAEKDMEAR